MSILNRLFGPLLRKTPRDVLGRPLPKLQTLMRTPLSTSGLVQLVVRRQREGLRADSQYFTTWRTMEEGRWDSERVNALLQVRPNPHYGLLCLAQEFAVVRNIHDAASSLATANPQFGPGGGERVFIPAREHAQTLKPVGDLIPLWNPDTHEDPEPTGWAAKIIDLELSLGNTVAARDLCDKPRQLARFWMQEPLHFPEIERKVKTSSAVRRFEENDNYTKSAGFFSEDDTQVIIAPRE